MLYCKNTMRRKRQPSSHILDLMGSGLLPLFSLNNWSGQSPLSHSHLVIKLLRPTTYVGEIPNRRVVELRDRGRSMHWLVRTVSKSGILSSLRWRQITENTTNVLYHPIIVADYKMTYNCMMDWSDIKYGRVQQYTNGNWNWNFFYLTLRKMVR